LQMYWFVLNCPNHLFLFGPNHCLVKGMYMSWVYNP